MEQVEYCIVEHFLTSDLIERERRWQATMKGYLRDVEEQLVEMIFTE